MVRALAFVASTLAFASVATAAHSWVNWGNGLLNQRNSGNSEISRHNAKNLALVWKSTLAGSISATPSVENGRVYVVDDAGFVYSISEATGSIIWSQNVSTLLNIFNVTAAFSRTTPAIMSDRVIIGVRGPAYEMALNKTTGALIWKTQVDSHPLAVMTQSPTVENNVIYQGVSSLEEGAAVDPNYPCCSFAGKMTAINGTTGSIIWSTDMIPPSLTGVGKYSGAAVWGSAPPVDSNNVYIGTGNIYALPPAAAACQEACDANPASCIGKPSCVDPAVLFDAIVALNKQTGAIVWATRLETTDAWTVACIIGDPANCPLPAGPDYDFGQAPILFGDDGLVAAQKSGVAWSLNRNTGAVRWSTIGGPGGTLGGFEWGSTVVDDGKGHVTMVGQISNNNHANFTLTNGLPWNGGVVVGINAHNGHINWQVPHQKPGSGLGAVSSSKEVAFAAAFETGIMSAFAVDNGELLWSYQTNATLISGPAVVGKRIYFGNGYSPVFGGTDGRNLYAFETA